LKPSNTSNTSKAAQIYIRAQLSVRRAALFAALALFAAPVLLAGCTVGNGSNIPAFLSGSIIRIEVTDNQAGKKGVASKDQDNLNELLNILHLGDLTTDQRSNAPAPASAAYTVVAYTNAGEAWSLQVPDVPQSDRVYLHDDAHTANDGTYPLKQPIVAAELDQFIRKYPAS